MDDTKDQDHYEYFYHCAKDGTAVTYSGCPHDCYEDERYSHICRELEIATLVSTKAKMNEP